MFLTSAGQVSLSATNRTAMRPALRKALVDVQKICETPPSNTQYCGQHSRTRLSRTRQNPTYRRRMGTVAAVTVASGRVQSGETGHSRMAGSHACVSALFCDSIFWALHTCPAKGTETTPAQGTA